jgi:uncharacterized protein YgiM (DUF1202 family)
MKMNLWLIAGTMVSASLLAQTATNTPIETPAAAPMATNAVAETAAPVAAPTTAPTNAPAAKPKKKGKKKSEKKAVTKPKQNAAELTTEPLSPGPAEVVATSVHVRGQPRLKSEIIGKLTKGEMVTVVEEVVRNNSGPDEPSAWAKILLPSSAHIWANTTFIDPATMTVKATRLNLRSGPGENFSVLGRLEHGDTVKQLTTKDNWMEIEPPTNAYAFVAAQYLKTAQPVAPTTAMTAATTAKPGEPAPTLTAVNEVPAIAPATNELATATTPMAPADTNAPAGTNETAATSAPAPEEPLPPRIVQREGRVRGGTSIQAPSAFELVSPETGATLDYLYTTSTNVDLRRYKGLRIIVTGEEGLDERWKSTPVLTIHRIQVVD